MPFCIIFFALLMLFLLCFNFSVSIKVSLFIFSVLGIVSVFLPSIEVFSNVYINYSLMAFILLFFIYAIIFSNVKEIILFSVLSIFIGYIYYLALTKNIFVSLDYNITFTFVLSLLPIVLIGGNLRRGTIFSFLVSLSILITDIYFWAKELEYVDINVVNYMNLLCVFISVNILLFAVKLLLDRKIYTLRKKDENNL